MSKKITNTTATTSIEKLDTACTSALAKYKELRGNKDTKAAALTAAAQEMDKAISAYNERVLAGCYSGFRASESNSLVELFVAGTWDKRRYSSKDDAFVTVPVRHDVLDFVTCSDALGNPVCDKTRLSVALEGLVSAVRQRVVDEMAQVEDVHVSIGEIVRKLQAVMDVLAVPEFEVGGQKAHVYARPKDARFLCTAAVKASRAVGKLEVCKASKIAAFITDVYYVQMNHEEYKVEA